MIRAKFTKQHAACVEDVPDETDDEIWTTDDNIENLEEIIRRAEQTDMPALVESTTRELEALRLAIPKSS